MTNTTRMYDKMFRGWLGVFAAKLRQKAAKNCNIVAIGQPIGEFLTLISGCYTQAYSVILYNIDSVLVAE